MKTLRHDSRFASPVLLAASVIACAATACTTEEPSPEERVRPSAASVPTAAPGYSLLSGSQSPLARASWDVGRMDPAARLEGMSLLFNVSPQQRATARRLLAELQDPTSPRYHRWLSPADVAATFGASGADVSSALAWLRSQGFTVHGASPTSTRVLFSGTVADVERAFRTEMHQYDIDGERHFALGSAPSVPSSIAPFVLGLHGVHDFRLRPANYARFRAPGRPDGFFDAGSDGGAPSGVLTLEPADFVTIYDIAPLYAAGITGSGQKIGIMGEGDFNDADVIAFRTTYGLDTSLVPIRDLVPLSGASYVSPYVYGETVLDLEWSGAVAKDAQVYYVYTGDNPAYGVYDSVAWAIEEGTYPVLSISYGGCELGLTPSENIYLETMGDAAAMEGITVVNSSGDLGPATCEYNQSEKAATQGLSVSWPSSIPSFVAVGGTMFDWGDPIPEPLLTPAIVSASPFDTYWTCSLSSSPSCAPTGYVPESAWNETKYEIASFSYFWGASGGGISTLFPKPYWQVGQTPKGSMRLLPDVSLSAAYAQVGYMVSQSWTAADGDAIAPQPEALGVTGGTSAAAPSFAGIVALVNQALVTKYPSLPVGLGNANPLLYAINASTSGTASPAFHDITTGDTFVPCKKGTPDCPKTKPFQYGYAAGPGYDMATGIGSIDANNLVNAWTTLVPTSTTLAVTPSGTTEGSTATLTATVASTATSTAMTGSVVFYMGTVDEGGLSDLAATATGALTATVVLGKEGGTATATVVVPPGLLDTSNIVAFYGGDANYLASWSVPSAVTATSTLAVTPSPVTLSPNAQQKLTATGGVPPIQWLTLKDTTCASYYYGCSLIESTSATTAAFQAGGADGTTLVEAIDADGAEVRVLVTVSGPPVDGGVLPPPWDGATFDVAAPDAAAEATAPDATLDAVADGGADAGTPVDGGADAAPIDAGHDAGHDAGKTKDATVDAKPPADASHPADGARHDAEASTGNETASLGGCSCRVGDRAPARNDGALAGLLLGLTFVGRRRRTALGRRLRRSCLPRA